MVWPEAVSVLILLQNLLQSLLLQRIHGLRQSVASVNSGGNSRHHLLSSSHHHRVRKGNCLYTKKTLRKFRVARKQDREAIVLHQRNSLGFASKETKVVLYKAVQMIRSCSFCSIKVATSNTPIIAMTCPCRNGTSHPLSEEVQMPIKPMAVGKATQAGKTTQVL